MNYNKISQDLQEKVGGKVGNLQTFTFLLFTFTLRSNYSKGGSGSSLSISSFILIPLSSLVLLSVSF